MEFMVNKQTGERIPTAGITLYADLPVGSWIKNDMGTIPAGFLKEGDTISQSEYPELYAKYGSTVPYKADKSELSDYSQPITFEQITAGYTMPYDGVMNIGANSTSGSTIAYISINNSRIVNIGAASYTGSFVEFRKGDVVRAHDITTNNYILKVAYYMKSLIVKAKRVGAPSDIITSVRDALGSYSTTETVVGTWVDGKPIYRQAISVGTPQLNSGNWVELVTYSFAVDAFVSCTLVNKTSSSTTGTQLYNNFQIRQGSSKKVEFLFEQNITAAISRYVILEYTKTTD